VTLTLPQAVYDEMLQRARQHHRRLEDEAALTLTAAVGAGDALPDDLAAAVDALATTPSWAPGRAPDTRL
jgi:plasmid stability protein